MDKSATFNLDYVNLDPDKQIGPHAQPTWELSAVEVGSGLRQIGNTVEPFVSGDCVIVPPEIAHCWNFDRREVDQNGRIVNYSLTFHADLLVNLLKAFPEAEEALRRLVDMEAAESIQGEDAARVMTLLAQLHRARALRRIPLLVELLLVVGSSGMTRTVGQRDDKDMVEQRLAQIRIYVVCNLQRMIRLKEAAAYVGMNRSAFCVFFRKATGQTFTAYVNGRRVERAQQLLRSAELAIAEVSHEAGFQSVPYFNRVFLRVAGCTPKKFRQSKQPQTE